jgi:ribosomal protein RSM22 (predicted rRNA methylase)
MLDAAKIMTNNKGVDCVFWDKIGEVVKLAHSRAERFDLIICGYTLNELSTDSSRKAAVQLLFELLDVGGIMLIIEPGNPVGSHTVRTARQFTLNFFNEGLDFCPDIDNTAEDQDNNNNDDDSNDNADGNTSKTKSNINNSTSPQPLKDPMDLLGKEATRAARAAKKERNNLLHIKHVLPPPSPFTSNEDLYATVLSPCAHDKPCPLGPGIWCSFAQKVSVESNIRICDVHLCKFMYRYFRHSLYYISCIYYVL